MTKRLLSICAGWTLAVLLAGLAGVWRIHAHPQPGVSQEMRAAKLGLSLGALTATGYAVFWLILALSAKRSHQKNDDQDRPNTGTSPIEETSNQ